MSLDRETLEEIAEKCLERPSDAMFWDDRLFTTHGALFHWAELGDDVLEESNYLSALALIQGAAGDDADEHVIDGSSRHWACGSLRTIYVQVYEDELPECGAERCEREAEYAVALGDVKGGNYCQEHTEWGRSLLANAALSDIIFDEPGDVPEDAAQQIYEEQYSKTSEGSAPRTFTAAFIEAAELAHGLLDYPIIDESDYSEREWEGFEQALKEAVEQAQREYTLVDTCEDDEAIAQRFYENEDHTHRSQWCRADDVSWSTVEEEYREERDAYFLEKATEVYRWNVLGYNPDQLELDIAV
ncbi:hypothetical protein PQC18_gp72 [Streptomyces phage Pablito]|uniref:Uncharacterized protein n=1 Tax=Streptomyces phage Pablito TaxID=2894593 RepID=A0AAE8YFI9_9CAUD|nr:hypothetical protein PQC18_gp72 [Streptomyces phage Pablito]UFD98010.1 hypothetical protein [Streptomyces phage Pablito]